MYSHKQGAWASKNVVFGVTSEGEYRLGPGELGPIQGARLTHLLSKLRRDPARLRAFLATLAEVRREKLPDALPLQAIRVRKLSWRIQPGLEGIEKPKNQLVKSIFLPPESLLTRLEEEAAGRASVLEAVRAPGDIVVDVSEERNRPMMDVVTPAPAGRIVPFKL